MKKFNSILLIAVLSITTIPLGGCSTATAQKAQAVIQAVINVALAETPIVPVQDQPNWKAYWGGAQVLDTAMASCIANAGGMMSTKGKISSCFTTFATALSSPANLALLRVVNPASQSKAQLYIASIVAGVNIIVAFVGPTIAPAPTAQEMHGLGEQLVWMNVLTEAELNKYLLQSRGITRQGVTSTLMNYDSPLCSSTYWNPEMKVCMNVPYCPNTGCAPIPAMAQ